VRRSYKAWTDEVVPGEENDISHTPWFGDERAKKADISSRNQNHDFVKLKT